MRFVRLPLQLFPQDHPELSKRNLQLLSCLPYMCLWISLEEIFHPLNVAFWCRRTTNRNSGPDRPRLQNLVNHPFKLPPVRQHPWVTGVELSAKGPAHQCNIFQLSILQDDEGRLLSIEGRICPEAELGLSGRSHPGSVWNSENRAILIKNQNRPLFGTQKYSRNPKKIDFTLRNNKLVCYSCFWSHCRWLLFSICFWFSVHQCTFSSWVLKKKKLHLQIWSK